MLVTQKCQYALRALFELARTNGQGPVKMARIAAAQAIPPRFLEVILSQLKRGEFVRSRRGNEGGYELIRAPNEITVGEVIRFIEGPFGPVECMNGEASSRKCVLSGDCVFLPMWTKVQGAVSDIYDGTSFQDFVDEDRRGTKHRVSRYAI